MVTPVNDDKLVMAFELVSAAGPFENSSYVNRQSGKIHWTTDADSLEEELPEDVEDESLYAAVPHKHDLDLGKDLVLRFTRQHLPDSYQEVRAIFGRRGAYGQFKRLLVRAERLEIWHEFERRATEEALSEWAIENGFEIVGQPIAGS